MTWRSIVDMTPDEIAAQLEQLREVVERLAASIPAMRDDAASDSLAARISFAVTDRLRAARDRDDQDVETVSPTEFPDDTRQFFADLELADEIPRNTLQSYLSDLARIGTQHGVELVPDAKGGLMRIRLITPEHGGYLAERVDDGYRLLRRYGNRVDPRDPTDDVVGEDADPMPPGLLDLLQSWEPLDDDGAEPGRGGKACHNSPDAARRTMGDPGRDALHL